MKRCPGNGESPASLRKKYQRHPKGVDAKANWEFEHKAERSAARKARRRANPWHFWAEKCISGKRAIGLDITITWPQINAMLKAQNFRCALTCLPFWKSPKRRGCASWDSPSLDRIRHGGPYSASNVRIVLHCVNTFRGGMGDDLMYVVARKLIRGGHQRTQSAIKTLWPAQRR